MKGHRLQLVLSEDHRELLEGLKELIEADSYGELVRRALIVAENNDLDHEIYKKLHETPEHVIIRTQLVLPEKSMQRLDRIKNKMKFLYYSDVIRYALIKLDQIYGTQKCKLI